MFIAKHLWFSEGQAAKKFRF